MNMGAKNTSNSGFKKLNEMNYGTWKMLMKALLVRKQLWDVVAGIESNLGGSPNLKAAKGLRKSQAEACAEIILHVKVSQLLFIADKDPKVVWDYLESIHQAHGMATHPPRSVANSFGCRNPKGQCSYLLLKCGFPAQRNWLQS
jgi:hypothetical protein